MKERSRAERFERLKRLKDGPYAALAIRYGRRYVADYPDHGPGWLTLGAALTEVARYEEAEQALARALELCPPGKRQWPLAQMGHLFDCAGDFDQATAWHRRAVEACPEDATFRIFLGSVLARQGRHLDAEEAHRSATLCPEGSVDEAYLNLGYILRARDRYAEAAECFRAAIAIDPEYKAAKRALRDVEACLRRGYGR